jgi:hypothetical protein
MVLARCDRCEDRRKGPLRAKPIDIESSHAKSPKVRGRAPVSPAPPSKLAKKSLHVTSAAFFGSFQHGGKETRKSFGGEGG